VVRQDTLVGQVLLELHQILVQQDTLVQQDILGGQVLLELHQILALLGRLVPQEKQDQEVLMVLQHVQVQQVLKEELEPQVLQVV
jgi:hypothetical protein